MRPWLVVLAAACGGGGGAKTGPTITVQALAGDTSAATASVITHRADGSVIDSALADAAGNAVLKTEAGALVSIEFPTDPSQPVAIVTTLAPAADGELTVYGPPPPPAPPVVIGTLAISAPAITADSYDVDLGCVDFHFPNLAQPIDLAAACAGTDTNIDVLVRAYSAGVLVGYAADRMPLSTTVFAPSQWQTTTGSVPVMLDGVSPALDWIIVSDGLPFAAQPITDPAPVWTGLVVDATTVHATLGAAPSTQRTTRETSGAPATIDFAPTDFLPPITPTLAASGSALHWTASVPGADAVVVSLSWTGTLSVDWELVLPPDTSDAMLVSAFAPEGAPAAEQVRYLDAPQAASFSDVLAAGLHVEDLQASRIVVPPSDGEIRETIATGFTP
jgi:hypothetical protein